MRTVAVPSPWLSRAATLWFLVAATGLAIFTAYIGLSYGRAALGGAPGEARWVLGDALGNGLLSAHLVAGLLLSALGVLQLVPALRRAAPAWHRWGGRLFMVGAVIASLSGFYLVWVRGTVGDASMHVAMSLNGVLIVVFAWRAWRHARARQFDQHRRWALRLFLAANGVWFFRVGLMLWLLIWQQPVGFDPKTFTGPFVTALSFGQFLLPLGVLELYLRTRGRGRLMALGLVLCSLATAVGIFGAVMGLWLPQL
jgi:hypothetical protein